MKKNPGLLREREGCLIAVYLEEGPCVLCIIWKIPSDMAATSLLFLFNSMVKGSGGSALYSQSKPNLRVQIVMKK